MQEQIDILQTASAQDVLRWALDTFSSRFAITTSFQREGMVLLDMAAKLSRSIRVVTLDTGRLPQQTYDMIEQVRGHYGLAVEIVVPETAEVESMVTRHGPNLFYESVAHRNLCCQIRKVRPLERKLANFDAYAVGLRRSQSETRQNVQKIEMTNGKAKLSPLADWTAAQVSEYTRTFNVPEHPLYAQNYATIGCECCTRAVQPGDHERAGRWWWESEGAKECGLHFTPEGKIERTVDVLLREILK